MTFEEREQQLMEELETLRQLRQVTSNPRLMQMLKEHIVPTLEQHQQPLTQNGAKATTRTFSQGTRKQVLLALLTGSATITELAAALGVPQVLAAQTIGGCVRDGLIASDGNEHYLTGLGKEHAVWFQKNPRYRVYYGPHRKHVIGGTEK